MYSVITNKEPDTNSSKKNQREPSRSKLNKQQKLVVYMNFSIIKESFCLT